MDRVSVTVGIPAYNEGTNLKHLLNSLLKQNEKKIVVEKIIISSDGSFDDTVRIAQEFKKKFSHFQIFDNRKREGVGLRQNQIMNATDSDILILIQADTRIEGRNFLEELARPIVEGKADLVSAALSELPPRNFFEETLLESMRFKRRVFENYKKGRNLYTCHGPGRAFSKRFYKKLVFPLSVGEDAYSFLFCQKLGFKYYYASKAKINYRLPNNLSDHLKQSLRFRLSSKLMKDYFGEEFVKKHYCLPKDLFLRNILRFYLNKPLRAVVYSFLTLLSFFGFFIKSDKKDTWDIALSSKILI